MHLKQKKMLYKLFRPVVKCSRTPEELRAKGRLKPEGVVESPVEYEN